MHAAGGNEGMKKEIAEAKICWSHQNVCQVTHTDRGWLIKEELPVQKKDEKNLTKISGVISKGGIIEHCTAFLHAPACWLLLQQNPLPAFVLVEKWKQKYLQSSAFTDQWASWRLPAPRWGPCSQCVIFLATSHTFLHTYLSLCMYVCLSSGNL